MSICGRHVSKTAVAACAAVLITVVGLLPVMTKGRVRQITLVTRNMAFYVEDDQRSPNPVIDVKAGETVRVVLRNRDRGVTHDFAVPALQAATKALDWDEEDEIVFEAPKEPGTYDYVCRPHVLMMRGSLRVTRD